ncbi:MAG: ABC transporter substrate-binding protein [Limnochordia bacterium]|jgi:multiple sugar transport system substrate-binding protein|nr:MAG: sugar ABC transporter substrate-binding protein [Peptococcaceae bacterium 1109]
MKRVSLMILVVLLVATLAAVAGAQETITLRYFMWDPIFADMERALIDEFEAQNPHIKVEMTAMDPSSYWPRISAMATAGELPDVFNMSTGYFEQWAQDGLLLNIQELVNRDLNIEDYFVEVFSENRYPDKQTGDMYAIPYAWVTPVLFYNKDMFDEAGLSYPSDDWTWDDFLEAAKKLTIQSDPRLPAERYGFFWYGRYAHVEPWVYANSGRILNEEKTRIQFDERAREALQFLSDLTNVHKVSPPYKEIVGISQDDLFPLRQVAMWVDGSWNIENIRQKADPDFRFGIARVPKGPSAIPGDDTTYFWPDAIAISATTQHKEAAWELVKFLIGENRPIESYMAGKVPIHKGLAHSEEWLQAGKDPDNMQLILEQGEGTGRTTFTLGWSEWRGYAATGSSGMNGELDKVSNGEQSVDEAIKAITEYGNSVLTRYYPEE